MATGRTELAAGRATAEHRTTANNFDALRLLAALMVIYGHGQDMKGVPPVLLWNFPISRIGLDVFFCVSGYLVADSWLRTPDLRLFLAKRALRIMPALLACLAVTVFVLGPLDTTATLARYFTHHATWQYFLNAAFYLRLHLPGVFDGRVFDGAINGSLWSLFPEVVCYLALPLVWLAPREGRVLVLLAIMGGCGWYGLWMFAHPEGQLNVIYGCDPKYFLVQVPFFMAAAALRVVQARWRNLFRLDVAVILTASNFFLPLMLGNSSVPFEWLTLAYVVIAFGLASTPVLRRTARFGDLSYGTYLYAFPVQQLVLQHVHSFAIIICTMCTLAVAWLSWHLVEAPALRLKPRVRPAAIGQAVAA